jgi:hypothetical protein
MVEKHSRALNAWMPWLFNRSPTRYNKRFVSGSLFRTAGRMEGNHAD